MSRDTRPAKIMDTALFTRIADQIAAREIEPTQIFLNMNGEPLQDPKFLERLAILKERDLAKIVELQTNGQFLDADKARAIATAPVLRVVLGFDGATKETYERHRVRCDYDRVLHNIREFVRIRDECDSPTIVAIQYVRTYDNAAEVGAAYRMFSEFLRPGRDVFQDNISKDWGDEQDETGLIMMGKLRTKAMGHGCALFESQLIVCSDGKVAACCWDYNLSVSDGGFADMNRERLIDAWRGQRRASLGARLASPRSEDRPKKCRTCVFAGGEPEPLPMSGALIDDPAVASASPYGYTYQFVAPKPEPQGGGIFRSLLRSH
jgi:MoaA/NifB/PqqE/SkfB family radical SAM enzyme